MNINQAPDRGFELEALSSLQLTIYSGIPGIRVHRMSRMRRFFMTRVNPRDSPQSPCDTSYDILSTRPLTDTASESVRYGMSGCLGRATEG